MKYTVEIDPDAIDELVRKELFLQYECFKQMLDDSSIPYMTHNKEEDRVCKEIMLASLRNVHNHFAYPEDMIE